MANQGQQSGNGPQPFDQQYAAPGQSLFEQLNNVQTQQFSMYLGSNSPIVKAITDNVARTIDPKNPYGNQDMVAMISNAVGLVVGKHTSNLFYGVQQAIGAAGLNVAFHGANGQIQTSQLFGPGGGTNQLSKSFVEQMQKDFYTQGGAQTLNRTYGVGMGDMGVIAASLSHRGAMAGMGADVTSDATTGRLTGKIRPGDQKKIEDMMSDTARTLTFMRSIFGGGPAQAMMQAAENLTGMSFSDAKAPRQIYNRLQKSVNTAMSFGADPGTWLNNESNTAKYIGSLTGDIRMGQAASLGVEFAVTRGRMNHQAMAAEMSAQGRYLAPFNENEFRAKLGRDTAGMLQDDKDFGNPLMIGTAVADNDEQMSDENRSALRALIATPTKNMLQKGAQREAINTLLMESSGNTRGLAYYENMDMSKLVSPGSLTKLTDMQEQTKMREQAQVFIASRSQGIGQRFGMSLSGDDAVKLNETLFRNMTPNQRGVLQGGLRSGSTQALSDNLKKSGMSSDDVASVMKLVHSSSLSPLEFSQAMAMQGQELISQGGLTGWITGSGSATDKDATSRRIAGEIMSSGAGTENVQQGGIMDRFLQGALGGEGMMQPAQIATVAKKQNREAFAVKYNKATRSLDKEGLDKEILRMKNAGVDFEKLYGTTDPEKLIELLSAEGGAEALWSGLGDTDITHALIDATDTGGTIVGVSKELTESLEDRQGRAISSESLSKIRVGDASGWRGFTNEQRLQASKTGDKGAQELAAYEYLKNTDKNSKTGRNRMSEIAKAVMDGTSDGRENLEALRNLHGSSKANSIKYETLLDSQIKAAEDAGDKDGVKNLKNLKREMMEKDPNEMTTGEKLLSDIADNTRKIADRDN